MDHETAKNIIKELLSEKDAVRFVFLTDKLAEEDIQSQEFAELNAELKELLEDNDIQLFALHSKENKYNSLSLVIRHKGRIINESEKSKRSTEAI